jgi:predicted MFS family arabinose efflux permease
LISFQLNLTDLAISSYTPVLSVSTNCCKISRFFGDFYYLRLIMALGIRQNSILTITFSGMAMWVGFYAWRIMFNNFAVEQFDANPTEIGIIQAVREVPGLLAFGVGALAIYLTEVRIASLAIMLMGVGLIICGLSPSLVILGAATFLLSVGFHYFEPANTSQLILLSDGNNTGRVQGRYNSYESLAGLIGGVMILVLTLFLNYSQTFYIIGGVVLAVGFYLVLALPSNRGKTETRKVKIKKKYWLYYTLAFLRGCRRHIFTTFAIFLLVKNHGLGISVITIIILLSNVATFFTNRLLGNLSDRLGERFVLSGCSLALIFIFSGYAFVTYLPVLITFYLIDNILFGSSIALKSYLSKIASSEELTGCLSFGMTANHITAVIIPVLGGIIWSLFGYEVTFMVGAAIVAIDLIFALMVPKKSKR